MSDRRTPGPLAGTALDDAAPGLDLCVHCGFCLQACPTYLTVEDENDSPRGRIMLMRAAVEGNLALDDPALQKHVDGCLGCRACETACPSGVPYGQLLEATRATFVERKRPIPWLTSLLLVVMTNEALRLVVLGGARILRALRLTRLLRRLPGRIGFAFSMLEASRPVLPSGSPPIPGDRPRGRVALLEGCVMEGLFSHTNRATERVLERNGYRMVIATGQRCCGALHAHAGAQTRAASLARTNIAAFERSGADYIAVNAAGCGAMMKEYGHLLRHDPDWAARAAAFSAKVRDVSELLAVARPSASGSVTARVTWDSPCHLEHAQRVVQPPLQVLRSIPGVTFVPLEGADRCCGGAGIYNLVEPDTSMAVLHDKLNNIRATGAPIVVTANPGCHMQIGAGLLRGGIPARCVHLVDLLDSACVARPEP